VKITNITPQARNSERVNISVDGSYRFSLDIFQVVELGIKIGNEYSEQQLAEMESESQFGKLYSRALEYVLMRPHSAKEIHTYLWKKTRPTRVRTRSTGTIKTVDGVSQSIADRVYARLEDKGYIDDEKFTEFWVENRNQTNGTSMRKLRSELSGKGVSANIIDNALAKSERNDDSELQKVIAKKRKKYDDEKLVQYLARQGFRYDDIKRVMNED